VPTLEGLRGKSHLATSHFVVLLGDLLGPWEDVLLHQRGETDAAGGLLHAVNPLLKANIRHSKPREQSLAFLTIHFLRFTGGLGPPTSSGFLKSGEYNVSETVSASVLR
jgi:hypothetical protein